MKQERDCGVKLFEEQAEMSKQHKERFSLSLYLKNCGRLHEKSSGPDKVTSSSEEKAEFGCHTVLQNYRKVCGKSQTFLRHIV